MLTVFLEHARVWYFYHGGKENLFIGSPDWMRRNLYRRIEVVTPVLNKTLKQEMMTMLDIQLHDNCKATWVDDNLQNLRKGGGQILRAQDVFYMYLKQKNLR